MKNDDIFGDYVGNDTGTSADKQGKEIKKFLSKTLEDSDIERYGSSKPKRIVLKARIKNG